VSSAANVLIARRDGKKQFIPSMGPIKGKIIAEIINKHKPKKYSGNWNFVWIFCDIMANLYLTIMEKL
jgi:hypothetical protein